MVGGLKGGGKKIVEWLIDRQKRKEIKTRKRDYKNRDSRSKPKITRQEKKSTGQWSKWKKRNVNAN